MKVFKIFQIIFIILLICLFVHLLVQRIQGVHHPKIFGYGFGIVLTGSMEPELPAGSLIVIHEEEIGKNDIITYNHYSGKSVTHRVTNIDGNVVTTKGDANLSADPKFDKNNVIGKVVYHCDAKIFLVISLIYAFYCLAYSIFTKKRNV